MAVSLGHVWVCGLASVTHVGSRRGTNCHAASPPGAAAAAAVASRPIASSGCGQRRLIAWKGLRPQQKRNSASLPCSSPPTRSLVTRSALHNFDERATRVIELAKFEAQRLSHNQVNTGHLLLGLVAEEQQARGESHAFLGAPITLEQARNALSSALSPPATSLAVHREAEAEVHVVHEARPQVPTLLRQLAGVRYQKQRAKAHLHTSATRATQSARQRLYEDVLVLEARERTIVAALEEAEARGEATIPGRVLFSNGFRRVCEQAAADVRTANNDPQLVTIEHLVISLAADYYGVALRVLERLGVSHAQLRDAATRRLQGLPDLPTQADPATSSEGAEDKPARSKRPLHTPYLERFAIDLTALAREGVLDPVTGRDIEVTRIIQILARRSKSNAVILGQPGIGKTAIVEGLAQRIVAEEVPSFLEGKRIFALDLPGMLAGSAHRGEMEARCKGLLDELIGLEGEAILFMDELHTVVGAGSMNGGMDVANILKPALARGEVQCIGATTLDEYRQHIESDKALARRFQPVLVEEPSVEDTMQILRGLRARYEQHHHLQVSDAALDACAKLSARYIPDRQLPDKAIDLLDEAASMLHMKEEQRLKAACEGGRTQMALQHQLMVVTNQKKQVWNVLKSTEGMGSSPTTDQMADAAIGDVVGPSGEFRERMRSAACELSNRERWLRQKLAVASQDVNYIGDAKPVVTEDHVAAIVKAWTGIPVGRLTDSDSKRYLDLDKILRKRVIGQEDAVSTVARAMRRSAAGLRDANRPIASMLFCGPSGVGKTELTKALAASLFGTESAMIRLDMSEYSERFTVSKLIGAAPGFVGFENGGALTEAIRQRPFSLLLLDEIEKAHPDVFNILLQVLEDGRLTDSKGRTVSFKNTMIVMTSNIAAEAIADGRQRRMGFLHTDDSAGSEQSNMRETVIESVRETFRPEFVNRIDEIVVFRKLSSEDLNSIAANMLADVSAQAMEHLVEIQVSDALMQVVLQEGVTAASGARPLRQAMMRRIVDPLSSALLQFNAESGAMLVAVLDVNSDNEITAHIMPRQ